MYFPNYWLFLGLWLFAFNQPLLANSFCRQQWQAANIARRQLDFAKLQAIKTRSTDPCPVIVLNHINKLMTQVASAKAQKAFANKQFAKATQWLNQAPITAWYTEIVHGDIAAARKDWGKAARHYNRALDLKPPQAVMKDLVAMAGQATVLSNSLGVSVKSSGNGSGLYRSNPGKNSRGSYDTIPAPIRFNYDESTLTPQGQEAAKLLAAYVSKRLQHQPNLTVTVVGHTDSRGSKAYNCRLSRRRAQTVATVIQTELQRRSKNYQVQPMPAPVHTQIRIQAQGEQHPFPVSSWSPNLTPEERFALDRRVELVFTTPNQTQENPSCPH
ncbi:hypothetical protein TI05_06305 [Achromatium sp. WMS3]|nr:hypothetical protein TI05_06305 [Achromatium sp. WMS3]